MLPTEDHALLTVNEVAAKLRISRPTFYTLVQQGAFPLLKVGASSRVRARDLDDYLDRAEQLPEGAAEHLNSISREMREARRG